MIGTVTLEDLLGRVRELRAEADAKAGRVTPGATPETPTRARDRRPLGRAGWPTADRASAGSSALAARGARPGATCWSRCCAGRRRHRADYLYQAPLDRSSGDLVDVATIWEYTQEHILITAAIVVLVCRSPCRSACS